MDTTADSSAALEPASPPRLTIEAIYTNKIFETRQLREPQWLRDGHRLSYLDNAPESKVTTIWIYDALDRSRKQIIPTGALLLPDSSAPTAGTADAPAHVAIAGFQWTMDERRILIARSPKRRSSDADTALYVYDLDGDILSRITAREAAYRSAKWRPDGRCVGYVADDDLYILDIQANREVRMTDTAAAALYNGRFGWVHEEELGLVDGWSWSPDGDCIAYIQVDERAVPCVDIPNYDDLHCTPRVTRYPKAGDPNPITRIGLIDIDLSASGIPVTRWIDLGGDPDDYIVRMQWSPGGKLVVQRMPRLQNRIDILVVDPGTGSISTAFTESDDAWVDSPGDLQFFDNTDEFIWLSDRSGHTHIYLCSLSTGQLRQVTSGAWDVEGICGLDSAARDIYYTAGLPTPLERHVFAVSAAGGEPRQVTDQSGVNRATASGNGQYLLLTHSSRTSPPRTAVHSTRDSASDVILDNKVEKLEGHRLGRWEFTTLVTHEGISLNAAILKPADFDPARQYPMLMHTYGGPASQVAMDAWGNGSGLDNLLAQRGILCALVDGRGSGMRGRDFKKATYLRLGMLEVDDQIAAARQLQALPYVDPERVGIWGWSYGGFMASHCILRGADVFRAAVAVAPVTHWEFYDSIYTERYMRRPTDNPEGYKETTPLAYADKLKGKFLLVHGLSDDNVHFQNSARLASELQKRGLQFEAMYYPGKAHGIEGVSAHVFTLITEFFERTLLG